jgi:hypothetical protein
MRLDFKHRIFVVKKSFPPEKNPRRRRESRFYEEKQSLPIAFPVVPATHLRRIPVISWRQNNNNTFFLSITTATTKREH